MACAVDSTSNFVELTFAFSAGSAAWLRGQAWQGGLEYFDEFYKKMISRIEIAKVSSAFAMEQMKYTTALPLQFARATRSGETS